ncbi:hypothetical protein [Roseateles sp. PN1]|uniref:hypothetical protein n=1 Tax=Roseateles sp. PN1 TaxID=3137372 RepID=UPI00313A4730
MSEMPIAGLAVNREQAWLALESLPSYGIRTFMHALGNAYRLLNSVRRGRFAASLVHVMDAAADANSSVTSAGAH